MTSCSLVLQIKIASSFSRTIVLYVSGLLLGLVQRNAMNLHSNQRIHNRVFFDIDFGQLLTTDNLKYKHESQGEFPRKWQTLPCPLHSLPVR